MKFPRISTPPRDLASPIALIRTAIESKADLRRDLNATLISAAIHLAALLLLGFWVFPSIVSPKNILVTASFDETEFVVLDAIDIVATEAPLDIEPAEQPVSLSEPEPVMIADNSMTPDLLNPSPQNLDLFDVDLSPTQSASSESIEGAVDSVTGAIEAKLEKGDVLVIWLLDSSASLVDDRQRVAARLGPFYERIATRHGDSKHKLKSAVVSFGANMKERVPPSDFGERIVSSVEELPIDRSGKERVFDAVARCADHYRKGWTDGQLVIVVWTDESGDDIAYLENAIATCRKNQASVSVVGPSSVLGADTGLHSYTDPKSLSTYQLPVKRGPETAVPERIELGYWFHTRMGGGPRRFRGDLPAWIGGQDLEGILCGFSPYALTRLAMQTGGSYTIFDRPEDRSPFDTATMANYAPSYGSLESYQTIVRASPLRRAVISAVRELEGKKVDAPPTMLFIKKTGVRAFDFERFYYPPHEFQAKLRSSRTRLTRQASRYASIVEQALAHVSDPSSPEQGLETLFESESSPRWRAWYDLTRGRLLATSVRLEEYRLTLVAVTQPGGLSPATNFIMFRDSHDFRSEGIFVDRAAEALQLLRRCVSEHQGTPWEVLAQRELDFDLGIGVMQRSLTLTPGGPSPAQPNLPRF